MSDLEKRLNFYFQHAAAGALPPRNLVAEAEGLLRDQQARIAALEAQLAAADGLAALMPETIAVLGAYCNAISLVSDLISAGSAFRAIRGGGNG